MGLASCKSWNPRTRTLTQAEADVKMVAGDKESAQSLVACKNLGAEEGLISENHVRIAAVTKFKADTAQIISTEIDERPERKWTISAPTYQVVFWDCP